MEKNNKYKLSKRESKFRQKIIYENHYKKKEQVELDEIIKKYNISYYEMYNRYKLSNILSLIGCPFKKVSKALNKAAISVRKLNGEFKVTLELLKEVIEKLGIQQDG